MSLLYISNTIRKNRILLLLLLIFTIFSANISLSIIDDFENFESYSLIKQIHNLKPNNLYRKLLMQVKRVIGIIIINLVPFINLLKDLMNILYTSLGDKFDFYMKNTLFMNLCFYFHGSKYLSLDAVS